MHRSVRQAGGVAPPIDCVQRFTGAGRATLLVVPTTRETLRLVGAEVRRARAGMVVVADPAVLPGALEPVAYLSLCRERGPEACSAFVFTDQIVDPPMSTVLVEYGGERRFLPATELLARANHGLGLHVWAGAGWEVAAGESSDPLPVLRLLMAYFQACDQLGDAWLMRDRQRRTRVGSRVDAAVDRVRAFESAIMQAFAGNDLPAEARALLDELGSRRTALLALRAG